MSFAFSMPPIRCCRPAVPGIAHGRARVSSSRRYGRNSGLPAASVAFASVAKPGSIGGIAATSGTCHGSAPLAM